VKPSERIDRDIAGIADWRGQVLATIRLREGPLGRA